MESQAAGPVETTSRRINGLQVAPNFLLCEFEDPSTHEVKIDPLLLSKVQLFRDKVGRPVVINSGYRTPEHNGAVGGAPDSQHLYGRAADLAVSGKTPAQLAAVAEAVGFGGI